mmetsp:Transcript_77174/g.239028  ORF Transcript_77174/g.239028 Transcript_77174/m.239028 type:complete len:217 (+) Transcript_77174:465-1115(+)
MSTEGAAAGSSRPSPFRMTTVCACCTPASMRLRTLRTGPTRKTVLSDSNISTRLTGGVAADKMMIGWWPGKNGCRSVLRNATTCGQAEPPVTTNVMREGSDRTSLASLASLERKSRSMGSALSSSPKSEFSLRPLRYWRKVIVDLFVLDLVSLRGPLSGCISSSRVRLSCMIRSEAVALTPWDACSRRERNAMRQSLSVSAKAEHASLLHAIAMTT